MDVKIQIYMGPATVSDALMCVKLGADSIGLAADKTLIDDHDYTDGVLPNLDQIAEIFAALPSYVMKVALTFETDITQIVAMVEHVKPTAIHLAGNTMMTVPQITQLRHRLPGIKIIQSIAVNKPKAIELALEYSSVCDFFLLDSKGTDTDHPYGIGGTGDTHDWDISAALVKRVNVPVILAGGLSDENVYEAIRVVDPWAVDSFTLTNVTRSQNSAKDPLKVKQFIQNAKVTFDDASRLETVF